MGILIPSEGGGSASFDFIQSTAPTITADGQVWLKPTDGSHPGTAGVWLSRVITTSPFVAYWVRETVATQAAYRAGTNSGSTGSNFLLIPFPYTVNDLLLESFAYITRFDSTINNGSNYWTMQLRYAAGAANSSNFPVPISINTSAYTVTNINRTHKFSINEMAQIVQVVEGQDPSDYGGPRYMDFTLTATGSPSALTSHVVSLGFRGIHP